MSTTVKKLFSGYDIMILKTTDGSIKNIVESNCVSL